MEQVLPDRASRLVAGRYRLLDGGFGGVWHALDTELGETVALKEIRVPFGLSDAEATDLVRRAEPEARLLAQLLDQPDLVTVYVVVRENGSPVIVMEYVPSRSLAAEVREEGCLPPHEVARTAITLVEALSAPDTAATRFVRHRYEPGAEPSRPPTAIFHLRRTYGAAAWAFTCLATAIILPWLIGTYYGYGLIGSLVGFPFTLFLGAGATYGIFQSLSPGKLTIDIRGIELYDMESNRSRLTSWSWSWSEIAAYRIVDGQLKLIPRAGADLSCYAEHSGAPELGTDREEIIFGDVDGFRDGSAEDVARSLARFSASAAALAKIVHLQ